MYSRLYTEYTKIIHNRQLSTVSTIVCTAVAYNTVIAAIHEKSHAHIALTSLTIGFTCVNLHKDSQELTYLTYHINCTTDAGTKTNTLNNKDNI